MRLVLIGDGESPHLLKWARALAGVDGVQLWAASSRGFAQGWDACLSTERRLPLGTRPARRGGNFGVLMALPRLAVWLRGIDPDWLHAHYLTSHGTLAWLAMRIGRLRARLVGSAWGSDVLVTPQLGAPYRWLTRRVLQACTLSTSDSAHMAERMRELGAGEVMTFPLGLDELPAAPAEKQSWLFYANRGLEPLYRPLDVVRLFAQVARRRPEARLVVANDGTMRAAAQAEAARLGLSVGRLHAGQQVEFTGLLAADDQARWYAAAQWYLSLPESDSVAVSVLEAMAHGCIPLLSDLAANREIVNNGVNAMIVDANQDTPPIDAMEAMRGRAGGVALANREWVREHGLFAPSVAHFIGRLRELDATRGA